MDLSLQASLAPISEHLLCAQQRDRANGSKMVRVIMLPSVPRGDPPRRVVASRGDLLGCTSRGTEGPDGTPESVLHSGGPEMWSAGVRGGHAARWAWRGPGVHSGQTACVAGGGRCQSRGGFLQNLQTADFRLSSSPFQIELISPFHIFTYLLKNDQFPHTSLRLVSSSF